MTTNFKGILLAGGSGTRLHPLTKIVSKQLLPLYNKPMIYYPLSTIMLAGVREVLLISSEQGVPLFRELLGDGSQWGIELSYTVQAEPRGIVEAFTLGESFIADDASMLVLGDNVLYGRYDFLRAAVDETGDGATIFAYRVTDPQEYGVVEFDPSGKVISLEEKPAKPKSNWAIPGVYLYGSGVSSRAKNVKPSARGELEITDLNRLYLEQGTLRARAMGRGVAWFDTGTPHNLLQASSFIEAIETRQGFNVGCPEEVAYRMGFIDAAGLRTCIDSIPQCPYRQYLERILEEGLPT